MSYAPKAAYSNPASPQVAYNEGPEVYHGPSYQYQHQPQPQPQPQGMGAPIPPPQPTQDKKILGLRRPTFWLSLLLLLVIIAAAVGGGVGGSLAVSNAKSVVQPRCTNCTNVPTDPNAISASTTTSPTSAAASTSTSRTASSASSSASASASPSAGAIYTPTNPIDVLRVNSTCPSSTVSATARQQTVTYSCNESTDYPGNDLMSLVAYTMTQCLEACITYNQAQGQAAGVRQCTTVAFSSSLAQYYKAYSANCFLKNSTATKNTNSDWTGLTLSQ